MPVNSWTMARKLDVSVVSTVVGARREALERFFVFRDGVAAAAPATARGRSDGGCTNDANWLPAAGSAPSEGGVAAVQLEELGMKGRGQGPAAESSGRRGVEESR